MNTVVMNTVGYRDTIWVLPGGFRTGLQGKTPQKLHHVSSPDFH